MLGTLFKLYGYTKHPKLSFALRHPMPAAQILKTPYDLRTAYAPRIAVAATALLVAPLAYRLGKRAGEGTLWTPRRRPAADASELPPFI